ncbi:MAG: hypothetical protein UT76_C0023G0011 [Candidatus Woesebacteria bacterium GW2011_GWB1_40_12]|uniref:Uncharacterized protein n=1 Tax=Candidatus Woesebacteria bacterium GW2011_GWB1_40_12 TaxID=1618576 RepID=A0A0G0QXZ7_9BACT|nr:MAG: hypothetical protein UT76_C0023G0011 [Candidatus Woesebacteria bacterium GW2011_GWB1_40_12]
MEDMATNVSGREVPMATKVTPMIRGDILILEESFSENFNNKYAEIIKKNIETKNLVKNSGTTIYVYLYIIKFFSFTSTLHEVK